MGMGLFGDDDE